MEEAGERPEKPPLPSSPEEEDDDTGEPPETIKVDEDQTEDGQQEEDEKGPPEPVRNLFVVGPLSNSDDQAGGVRYDSPIASYEFVT